MLTEESLLAIIPENLSFVEAAAVPEAFITARDAVFTQANLQKHETLLIHAVSSGVGLAALQLAKAQNSKVIGTSRTRDKLDKCRELGLDLGVLVDEKTNFAEIIKREFGGVDVVLDLVGAKYLPENLDSLNLKGRLILVGTTSGAKAELNFGAVMSKRLKIIGTVLRSRSTEEKAKATKAFVKNVVPLLESGAVVPNIDRVFKMDEIRQAHEYLESNESFGKVVLEF